jgi:hypothetical protein
MQTLIYRDREGLGFEYSPSKILGEGKNIKTSINLEIKKNTS